MGPASLAGISLSAAVLLSPVSAGAQETRRSLGDGYDLVVDRQALHVVRGKQRARLVEASAIVDARLDRAARKVQVEVDDFSCQGRSKHTFSVGQLDARLENTSAYALYKQKDFKGALPGFTRAAAADPAWRVPTFNLASVQTLLGDQAAAVATLAPLIAAEPVAVYVKVTTDPDLAPLLARPELRALRAKRPGSAKVIAEGPDGVIGYAPERRLIAVTRKEASWGTCSYEVNVELLDVATGKSLAAAPLVEWKETTVDCDDKKPGVLRRARAAVTKRAAALQTMLAELGFATAKVEQGTSPATDDGGSWKSRLPKRKLGVVTRGGATRVVRDDDVLATGTTLEQLHAATYVDEARAIVIWSGRPGAEGCESTDPTAVTVIATPPDRR